MLRVHPKSRILTNRLETFTKRELPMPTTNVLLVDDEIPFVETVTRRLSKRGLHIVTALSGEEALGQLEKDSNIEIVVLDVKMPGMGGLEILAKVKREYPLVEVIILTGHPTVESAIEGMKLGVFDYLMKPCDIDQLISKVEEAVATKRHHKDKDNKARIKGITS